MVELRGIEISCCTKVETTFVSAKQGKHKQTPFVYALPGALRKIKHQVKTQSQRIGFLLGGAAGNRTPVRLVTHYSSTGLGYLGFSNTPFSNIQNKARCLRIKISTPCFAAT